MRSLRIAVVANRKASMKAAAIAAADAFAEYDTEETILSIQSALRSAGHETFFLEADGGFADAVRQSMPDICFNIAEGLQGDSRESHIPAILEMLSIPYTGSKVLTHAISLDKVATKRIWRDLGLPTAPFQSFTHWDLPLDPSLEFPLFVKPVHEGSGMGITVKSIVHTLEELREQIAWVIQTYKQPALVEAYLPGREFTVGVLGNQLLPGEKPHSEAYTLGGYHVFPVLELDTQKGAVKGVYNAQAKSYAIDTEEAPGYLCPADIPETLARELQILAVKAFDALGGLDIGRVDFRLGAGGEPYLLEINTLPGLNPVLSDIVIAAYADGVSYEWLINEILDLAWERYHKNGHV